MSPGLHSRPEEVSIQVFVQGLPDPRQELAPGEGFLKEDAFLVLGITGFQGVCRVPAGEDHRSPEPCLPPFVPEGPSAHAGHDHVQEGQIHPIPHILEQLQGFLPVGGGVDRIAGAGEDELGESPDLLIVLGQEDRLVPFRGASLIRVLFPIFVSGLGRKVNVEDGSIPTPESRTLRITKPPAGERPRARASDPASSRF